MKRQVKYISELGLAFDMPKEAIKDDERLPNLIEIYENDVSRMEAVVESLEGKNMEEIVDRIAVWQNAIAVYKQKWEQAQVSWPLFGTDSSFE